MLAVGCLGLNYRLAHFGEPRGKAALQSRFEAVELQEKLAESDTAAVVAALLEPVDLEAVVAVAEMERIELVAALVEVKNTAVLATGQKQG